ncbi:MAG: RidA family protein [Erysipelotrichaceae bacterium]|nr:RidA family protein [Erysipelotrichaceae bacterium]
MKKIRISTEGTRIPPKMYSQAIIYDGIVYVSGQLGRHPEDGHLDLNDPEAQIRQSFRNVEMILEASGSSMENILELTCYLKNKEDLPVLNKVYAELFEDMEVPPARCCVCLEPVVDGCLFEVTCNAHLNQ